jgi:hypothetical protein
MNYLAAKAEMIVRTCRWGESLGSIAKERREFVTIISESFFNRLETRAKKQVEDRKRMMQTAADKNKQQ